MGIALRFFTKTSYKVKPILHCISTFSYRMEKSAVENATFISVKFYWKDRHY